MEQQKFKPTLGHQNTLYNREVYSQKSKNTCHDSDFENSFGELFKLSNVWNSQKNYHMFFYFMLKPRQSKRILVTVDFHFSSKKNSCISSASMWDNSLS